MLADVKKQAEAERKRIAQAEIDKYNKPYKRDTIIYFDYIYNIGGIQTWIQNLGLDYEFSVVYDKADPERLKYFEDLGIETIRYVGQPIECNTLITCIFGKSGENIKAKRRILSIHGDYKELFLEEAPKHDETIACSKVAAEHWEEVTGEHAEAWYNPIKIVPTIKPLVIGVFSRLSKEKGKWRVQFIIEQLKASGKPFLMVILTDLPFEEKDPRVIFLKPEMNVTGWIQCCDYVAQLSDTEAAPMTVQEALKLGKPLLITKLPMLEEFGINETNAKIYEFDMSNFDLEDLWNIPKVNNWKEPVSKEWSEIMKKRVFREKQAEEIKPVEVQPIEVPKKKTSKKKAE